MALCDRCQVKINVLTRKLCSECHTHFCSRCITNTDLKKSEQMCQRCSVFTLPVMERGHLTNLSLQDLKHYPGIEVPLSVTKEVLMEMILGHQAKVLTLQAQKAVQQLHTEPVDVLTVDAETLQPPSSAYSSSQPRPTGSSPGSTSLGAGSNSASVRSRVKQQFDLRKSTEVLDTSSIAKIEDLQDESQIDLLSVRQLKRILLQNCIDYHGCVEKHELMDRVHRLWQERAEQKEVEARITAQGDVEAEHEYLCKICMDSPVDCVFLNCGHMLTCVKCGRQLCECPVCRQYIVKVVHAFRV